MARLENSIGIFRFAGMVGNPEPPSDVPSLDERAGVRGTEITREGLKGRPFIVRTWVDMASYEDAWLEFRAYLALRSGDAVELVHAGISTQAVEGYLVNVLNVVPVDIRPIRPGAGGINPPSLGLVVCDWELVAVPL